MFSNTVFLGSYMLFTYFHLMPGKNRNLVCISGTAWKVSKYGVTSGLYFPVLGLNTRNYGPEITPYLDNFHAVQQADNIFGLNPQLLCWQIDTKKLNIFFHRFSYKNSCVSKLMYNSSVLVLMVCSFNDALKDLALDFVLLVLKACC